VAPHGLDGRGGPRQGRARRRPAHPAQGVDDAQPRRDLPRTPDLSRPAAGVRRLSRGQVVPLVRHRRDRPRGGGQAPQVRAGARCGGEGGMTRHTGSEPPEWLLRCEVNLHADLPDWFTRFEPPENPPRRSAVLMLFGPGADGPRVVLTERSETLRSPASQVSFPGGKLDPGETAVQAALRETWEEVGLDPSEVEVIGSFPDLWLGPSSNAVTPVLGWVREPHPLRVIDRGEVARVEWVPVADL